MSESRRVWQWLLPETVMAIHDMQLAEHGGGAGVRDAGLLESALSKPKNLALYADPDAADLAAAYGWGICRNHAFIDGNKRTGFVCALLFLRLNGYPFLANQQDCVAVMLNVAAGNLDEVGFAAWLRKHSSAKA